MDDYSDNCFVGMKGAGSRLGLDVVLVRGEAAKVKNTRNASKKFTCTVEGKITKMLPWNTNNISEAWHC